MIEALCFKHRAVVRELKDKIFILLFLNFKSLNKDSLIILTLSSEVKR